MKIDEIYYLIPGKSLDEGLRRVYNAKEVLEMIDIVVANRFINLYVLHGVDEPEIVPMIYANIPVDGASIDPQFCPSTLAFILWVSHSHIVLI